MLEPKYRIKEVKRRIPISRTFLIPGIGPFVWLALWIFSPSDIITTQYYIEKKDKPWNKWIRLRMTHDKEKASKWLELYQRRGKR